MGLLLFIGNSYRRWAERLLPGHGERASSAGRISLYPEAAEDTDAESHDLSYEDAVLEAELRHFMRREFGRARAPKGVFLKVLSAVYYDAAPGGRQRPPRASAFPAPMNFYRSLAAPHMARLVSGAVAVALLLLFVSANYYAMPGSGSADIDSELTGAAGSTAAHRSLDRSEGGIDRPRPDGWSSGAYETYAYHPAELGRPGLRDATLQATERKGPLRYYDGERIDLMGSEF